MKIQKETKNVMILAGIIILLLVSIIVFPTSKKDAVSSLEGSDQNNEIAKINNGIYWYQSWEVNLPAEIEVRFEEEYDLYGINFFIESPEDFLRSNFEVYYLNDEKNFELVSESEGSFEEKGFNLTSNSETYVYVLHFNPSIKTDSLKILFKDSSDLKVISLREIGVWKGMEEEYQEKMSNYKKFAEIVESREKNAKSNEVTYSIFHNKESLSAFEKNVDEEGVPVIKEGFSNKSGYHPSHICRYAIHLSSRYQRSKQQEDLRIIKNLMDWIEENKVEESSYVTWEFYQDYDAFGLKAPWTSALINAWCAGALLQGYKVTGEKQLETSAKKALEYLFVPIKEGGGLYEFEDDGIWFEEYPNPENPSHVLNGFIFAIDILDMFASYYEDERYEDYFNRAIIALRENISEYDVDYGSIYDLYTRGNKLGTNYHKVHYEQLFYIYLKTSDEYFLELSRKWYELDMQSDYTVIINNK